MAQVLNLKELRSSSALKAEIQKLEEDIQQLKEQMGRQKLLEKKLNDDIVNYKKDFDHLEKQFAHFAGLETEFEELQQELQMERLEKLINGDKKDNQVNVQVKKARDDLLKVQAELKELKKLDPLRLKRQVTDLKKKNMDQAKDNKNLSSALVTERKEVKELTNEKDRLEYYVSLNKTEFTRKDYMDIFKDISSATASRDLKKGAELGLFEKIGEKNKTIYRLK